MRREAERLSGRLVAFAEGIDLRCTDCHRFIYDGDCVKVEGGYRCWICEKRLRGWNPRLSFEVDRMLHSGLTWRGVREVVRMVMRTTWRRLRMTHHPLPITGRANASR